MSSKLNLITRGIIKENPVLVLLLGTCPALATSTSAINGLGMGIAATLVLIGSNVVISMLKNVIPDKVRIPAYIVVIAGFVTVVGMLIEAYAQSIYQSLGIFLPLIVVNCIILGRAEMFANKSSVFDSLLDGIGMGLGFTFALVLMGGLRELIGAGELFGIPITSGFISPVGIMTLAPGGFFIYGVLIAAVNKFSGGKAIKKKEFGCSSCPMAASCPNAMKEEV